MRLTLTPQGPRLQLTTAEQKKYCRRKYSKQEYSNQCNVKQAWMISSKYKKAVCTKKTVAPDAHKITQN